MGRCMALRELCLHLPLELLGGKKKKLSVKINSRSSIVTKTKKICSQHRCGLFILIINTFALLTNPTKSF